MSPEDLSTGISQVMRLSRINNPKIIHNALKQLAGGRGNSLAQFHIHLFEPCKYYVGSVGDLLAEAKFDLQTVDHNAELKSTVKPSTDLLLGLANLQICNIIIQQYDSLVESIEGEE